MFINILQTSFFQDQTFLLHHHQLKANVKWKQHAKTIAAGNGEGDKLNQLNHPYGIYVDHQPQHIYIADQDNHRIVKWKLGENNGQIVEGEMVMETESINCLIQLM